LVRVSGRAAELCRVYGVDLADQMDFGGAMAEQFHTWFEEGRRSVTASPTVMLPSPEIVTPASPPVAIQTPVAPEQAVDQQLPSLGQERKPACTEPWKSLYILRRGVFPCCYGGAPIAPMDEYRQAWNGAAIQAIRSELSAGRFHDYCLRSTTFPFVCKAAVSRFMPWWQ